jgi:cysteine desulfurase
MSNLASTSFRQASRLCLKQSSSSAGILRASNAPRAAAIAGQKSSRRGYVHESKKDNAQVNVDTAIRADQKAFFAETGKLPERHTMPGTSVNADAMMSPMAGELVCPANTRPLLIKI